MFRSDVVRWIIYICFTQFKKFFTISSIPILCMWVGTILVVVSPGNFQRQGGEISGHFINFIHLLPHLSILYLSLAIVVISYLLNKSVALNVTRNKAIIWWSLLFAILFGVIANTGLWSLTGVEFYAAILLISYLHACPSLADDIPLSPSPFALSAQYCCPCTFQP